MPDLRAFLEPLVREHLLSILIVWGWLFVGTLLATWVVWDARRRGSRRGRFVSLLVQFVPPLVFLYGLARHRPKPFRTPFGEVKRIDDPKALMRTGDGPDGFPARLWIPALFAGLFPGLGQLAFLRIGRALFIWAMMAFAAFFIVAHDLGVERTWPVPDWVLPESKRGQDVTINFKVPGYFYLAMLAELTLFTLFAYRDSVRLADEKAEALVRRDPNIRLAYYELLVEGPASEPETLLVEKESFIVGSAERCDVRVQGEDVLPEHVIFYVHHQDAEHGEIQFRCLAEEATVAHNGKPAHAGTLRPGDDIEIGGVLFTFRPLG